MVPITAYTPPVAGGVTDACHRQSRQAIGAPWQQRQQFSKKCSVVHFWFACPLTQAGPAINWSTLVATQVKLLLSTSGSPTLWGHPRPPPLPQRRVLPATGRASKHLHLGSKGDHSPLFLTSTIQAHHVLGRRRLQRLPVLGQQRVVKIS